MPFDLAKSATHRLARAAKAQRARSGAHLTAIGLYPGQEHVLKALSTGEAKTMSALAAELGVQPPTVTKMVTRLAAGGFVLRQTSEVDGRLARVSLTETGRALLGDIDKLYKRVEKEALAGFDDKDRKRIRKLLKKMEKNLLAAQGIDLPEEPDDLLDIEEAAE
ncbi:MarR family winged helix-turn-helix transcriptional regulator [Acuticoccus yangtzensis]|uniref:MarR family winged helix-turn-helix transcriptional regulator n=1 Tax=Acuticoccus yangtzensis TaxID=1443441 RepID=UPI0009496587|nr:MarR family transcriptional regulator [Acuticoccus yangtzensis]ORE92883.1 MarR family transcriptional regulator [Stappia sp. 22II-S9-Z10]